MRRRRTLPAEGLALLDAEPVLLVDHDQPEVEEPDVVAQQRVRADDDARAARYRAEQGLLAFRRRQLAGEKRRPQPRGEVGAERRDDRAEMLRGENLGRREQHRLAARVGDRQHCAQRDQGLARADLALDEAVHGRGAREIRRDLLTDQLLVPGQLERHPRVEFRRERARQTRSGRALPQLGALPQQGGLQHERLLESQRRARGVPVRVGLRAVDELERARVTDQAVLGAHGRRHGILEQRQRVEGRRDRLGDLPARHGRGRRIDRDRLLDPAPGRRIGEVARLVEQLVLGMSELAQALVGADLAREGSAHARPQLVLAPALIEEGEGEDAPPVGDLRLEDRPALGLHRALLGAQHLGHDRDVAVEFELVEGRELPALGVAPRVVAQQVADRDQPEALLQQGSNPPAERRAAQLLVEGRSHPSRVAATGDPGAR